MKRLLLSSLIMLRVSSLCASDHYRPGHTANRSDLPYPAIYSSANLRVSNKHHAPNGTLSVQANANATEGGAAGSFTIKLPAGVTAINPITVNYTLGGTATAADYNALTGTAIIAAGQNGVTITVTAADDKIIELTESLTLTVTGGNDGLDAFVPEAGSETASLDIVDDDNTLAKRTLRIVRTAHAGEPATNGGFSIQLMDASVPVSSEDITVNYTVAGTATPGVDYTALTGSVVIPAGQNSVPLNVQVIDDWYMEATETVIVNITGGSSASFNFPASATAASNTATANITDEDNTPANRVVTLSKTADAAEPSTNGNYRVSLPPNILCPVNINVTYFVNVASTATGAGTDYLPFSTIVIPAGQNYVDIPLRVVNDGIIENTETIILALSGTSTAGFGSAITANAIPVTMNIADDDNTAANRVVEVTVDRDGVEGGVGLRFKIAFPTGIIPSENTTVNYTVTGTAVKGTDYTPLATHFSGSTIITTSGSGANAVVANVVDDSIIEGLENVVMTITSVTSPGFTYTFGPSATATITDNDAVPANQVLAVSKTADGAEPGTNAAFQISLPSGLTAAEDITVNYTLGGTATKGTDYADPGSTVIIPAGQNSVPVAINVTNDQLIEGDETVILTITGGTSASLTYTADATNPSATATIGDDENIPANRVLSMAKTADAAEPSTNGSFSISLPAGITAGSDITVNYTISGSATAGTDYTALSGTAIIPAGQNSVAVTVTANDDNAIELTETVVLTVTGGTATGLTYTAATGSESASLDITDNDNTLAKRTLRIVRTAHAGEPATNGGFNIQLMDASAPVSSEDITVNYTVAGTATPGVDYTALSGSVVIPAGQNSVPLNVQVINDWYMEATETVIVTITGGSSASFTFPASATAASNTATANITDEDNTPANRVVTLSKTADAAEPSTNGNYRVSLPPNILCPVNINVTYFVNVASTATGAGTDYLPFSTIVIPAGQNYVDIPLRVVNDGIIENTETIILALSGTSTAGFGSAITANAIPVTMNIADDDNTAANRVVEVTVDRDGVEGGVGLRFKIAFPTGIIPSENTTVNYTVTGTAVKGTDYTPLATHFSGSTIITTSGSGANAVVANVVDDSIIEGLENVVMTITSVTSPGFTYTFGPSATATITDNDAVPANQVLAVSKTADGAEPGTNAAFQISLPSGLTAAEDITVNYTLGGTATKGTDYADPGSTVIIPAGQNSVPVAINVTNDQLIEGDETVILTITGGTSASLTYTADATNPSATATISDDDNTPANQVLSIAKTADAAEPSTNGSFSISLPTGITATENITVNYTVSGSATAGTDYAALSGTAIIPAGQNSVALTVAANDDNIIEATETVVLNLTGGTTGSGLLFTPVSGATTASLDIADNDNTLAKRTLRIVRTAHAGEPVTNGGFNIQLMDASAPVSSEDITVNYTVTGTATPGVDYTALTGSVVIPAGQNSVPLNVQVIDDWYMEATETVIVNITGGSSASFTFPASATAALNTATANITDEDNTLANRVLTLSKTADAAEPGTNGNYRVSLLPNILCPVNINVTYFVNVASTATGAGTDYLPLGTIVIPAGQNYVDIPVKVVNDGIIENTETIILALSGTSTAGFGSAITANAIPVTMNITDDDNTVANRVLSIAKTADAAEPSTNGGFSISLPTGITATENVTVNYTVAGSATAGTDYSALSGSVIIPAGQNSVAIPVLVTNDNIIEGTETLVATLTGATSTSFSFSAAGNATVNIADDENIAANLALSIAKTADAAEPSTNGSFTISLPAGITTTENVTVNYTVAGSATAVTDYTALSGSVIIPAGQNSVAIPVLVTNDNIIEGTETLVATLTGATSTSFSFSAAGNATVNIADDENIAANLALSIAKTADAAEPSTNGSFTISLPAGITTTENVTVNYTVAGSATAGTDYTALSGSVIIPAGQNSVAIPVLVTNDNIIEGTETLVATLTGATSTSFSFSAAGNATVNIADDENIVANLALSIAKTADAAEPSTNGGFSISLPAGITATENVTVNYTVAGSATAGTDYTALSGSVIIPAGQNAVSIPLVVKDDNLYEDPETVSLSLTGGTSSQFTFVPAVGAATAIATVTDNDKKDQVIIFTALPGKTLGDAAFTINATGGASGNPVTYTSSNPAVATITGNTVTIVGVGTANITASQAGNATYHAATDVMQVLTVAFPPNTAPTLATIANQQQCLSTNAQTIALSGVTAGTEQNQSTTISVSTDNPALFSTLSVAALTGGNAVLNYTLSGIAGTASITVTVKDNGGTQNGGTDTFSRTFSFSAIALPKLQIVASAGTTISKGQTITLSASGATAYVWENASGIISGQQSAALTVRPAQTTTYTVTGTNASGCTSTTSITITVNEDYNLVANNVLTPNGDGKNDFFVVKNIDMYPNNEVRIFDRAGREVYGKKGYNNEWDGTINGTPLDENTYYYIIDLGKNVKPLKGFITIVRKY